MRICFGSRISCGSSIRVLGLEFVSSSRNRVYRCIFSMSDDELPADLTCLPTFDHRVVSLGSPDSCATYSSAGVEYPSPPAEGDIDEDDVLPAPVETVDGSPCHEDDILPAPVETVDGPPCVAIRARPAVRKYWVKAKRKSNRDFSVQPKVALSRRCCARCCVSKVSDTELNTWREEFRTYQANDRHRILFDIVSAAYCRGTCKFNSYTFLGHSVCTNAIFSLTGSQWKIKQLRRIIRRAVSDGKVPMPPIDLRKNNTHVRNKPNTASIDAHLRTVY